MRYLISFFVLAAIIFFVRWFIIFVPHIQYSSLFLTKNDFISDDYFFLINYAELIVLFIFGFFSSFYLKYKLSYYFLFFAILSLPSVCISIYYGYQNIYYTLYSFVAICLFAFFIQHTILHHNIFNKNAFDFLVLSLFISGVLTKLYQGFVHGPNLAPELHFLHYSLISRGGGVGASNHLALLMLFLLPLVRFNYSKILIFIFVLLSFSRLSWLVYSLYIIFNMSFSKLTIRPFVFASFISLGLLIIFIDPDEFFNRLMAFDVLLDNDRFFIWSNTFKIISDHHFLGIGIGSFQHVYSFYSDLNNIFSNPHNLFLTILVEMGLPSFIFFIFIFIRSLIIAFTLDQKKYFVSLLIFLFMGFFSGQLYETSLNKFSMYDLFILGFVLAMLEVKYYSFPKR